MTHLFATLAFLGFAASLTVHVAALLGIDVASGMPFIWLLHLGVFLVFGPFVFASRKVFGARPGLAQIRQHFPAWVVVLGSVILAYAMLNFLLFLQATQGGSASIQDGKFVLQEHGRLIRELSASEYASFKANELRGFSGHWLVFYFVPFAYFRFCKTQPV